MRAHALLLLACVATVGCELREIVTTDSDDIVIAEITLRAGASVQTAVLHRTYVDPSGSGAVPGARVEITNARGEVLLLSEMPDSICIAPSSSETPPRGTCYASAERYDVSPGATYSLRIQLAGGGTLTATTQVPGDFQIVRPASSVCALAPNDTLTLQWRAAKDAWVYGAETSLHGLAPFLASNGITLPEDPLRLFGLSLSSQDTTILFPTEFGVFQRVDEDLTKALVLLQSGLPRDVVADVVIAAADRNYVNWERGGNFNPSGMVRVASIRGAGTGVFGSIVPRSFQIRIGSTSYPPC